MTRGRTVVALALAGFLALAVTGCSRGWSPARVTAPAPAIPVATTPVGAVELFRWAYVHRSIDTYRALFADDFVFNFATLDPAGETYRATPWNRADEMASAQHLFVGGSLTEEPATSITLDFGNALADLADPAGPDDPRRRRVVMIDCVLDIQRPSSSLQVTGGAVLHLVRGDVAAIPPDLGAAADSTRWFIGSWDDYTSQVAVSPAAARTAAPAAAQPMKRTSWGQVKSLYR